MINVFQGLRAYLRDKNGSLGALAPIMLIILVSSPLHAENIVVPKGGVSGKYGFHSRVDLGLAGDVYLTKDSANNAQANGALIIENKSGKAEAFLDIGAGGLIGESSHTYIKAPQFYYRWGRDEHVGITVGRVNKSWSLVDDFWNMGLTQPLFLWDAARPEAQGLTGFFLDVPLRRFKFTLFASYVFLPTQGATYENLNGKLISSNPWFADPVEGVSFGGQKFDLNYEVDVPDAAKVILQPAIGFNFRSRENNLTILNAFYLLKPKNDLVLPFEGALNSATLQGDIVVKPRVAQHHVAGADLGFKYSSYGKFFASWLYEGGIEYSAPLNTSYPEYPDQNIFSLTSGLKLYGIHDLWLSYIHTERTATRLKGVFDSSSVNAFALRNRFEKALRIKGNLYLFSKKKGSYKGLVGLSYTYDTEDQGSWVSSIFKWAFNQYFEVFTQCDLFGGPQKSIVGNHFIDRYQNNDRCIMGGSYAF